ncbi:MAG: hydroxymethylglutaryl-CoA lyase [Acidimicrobiales bacterium]
MVATGDSRPRLPLLPSSVSIREVGPRDGLQGERLIAPERRAELVLALITAGCKNVEAGSFVSEKAVPAMAGAREVIERLPRDSGAVFTALVANLRGAEAALETAVDEITVTVAASAVYNERNVHRTIEESVGEIGRIARVATAQHVPVDAVISCAFGSPYEGDIPPREVAGLAGRLIEAGSTAITLADTTGMATPRIIDEALEQLSQQLPGLSPGLHLHETRGTALVNAYAALGLGVTRFDTSIGGLGGSPFADGAGGNLATEDFVALLDDVGVESGIDLDRLLEAAEMTRGLVGRELPSKVSRAGGRLSRHVPEALGRDKT